MNYFKYLLFLLLIPFFVNNAYAVSATGGTITNYTQGTTNWTAHIFTNHLSSESFVLSSGGDVEILIVGGGGGGGGGYQGGGGGAGGLMYFTTNLSSATYTIYVGKGGEGCVGGVTGTIASNGFPSAIFNGAVSVVTVLGGGRGGSETPTISASTGGSGGGGMRDVGASGTSGQGYAGGDGATVAQWPCGGGGGASGVGGNGTAPSTVGLGGVGTNLNISGVLVTYATGGNGGWRPYNNGQQYTGASGAVNTGSGGEGGGGRDLTAAAAGNGGNGGSGIVIIRYIASSSSSLNSFYRPNLINKRNLSMRNQESPL